MVGYNTRSGLMGRLDMIVESDRRLDMIVVGFDETVGYNNRSDLIRGWI